MGASTAKKGPESLWPGQGDETEGHQGLSLLPLHDCQGAKGIFSQIGARNQGQMDLRPYQEDFKREIYAAIRQGHKRVLCCCATGGGKTVVYTKITQDICSKDRPVVVCVKRRKLIKQASDTFRKAGIPHGVYMANHPRWRPCLLYTSPSPRDS